MRSFLSRGFPLAVLAAFGMAACSSNNTDNGTGTTACTFTLSGGLTATNSCIATGAIAAYANASGKTTVALSYGTAGSTNSGSVAIQFNGTPSNGSHASTAADVTGGVSVVGASSTALWVASVSNGTGTGTFTLNITSVSTAVTTSVGNTYTIHGTLTAVLPAVTGTTATGTVTLTASF